MMIDIGETTFMGELVIRFLPYLCDTIAVNIASSTNMYEGGHVGARGNSSPVSVSTARLPPYEPSLAT